MPAIRKLPSNSTLQRWVDEGLSHDQIRQRIREETGQVVARSTVSAALSRAGFTKAQMRYTEEIPWRVNNRHMREYPVRMLRLLGRRRAGLSLKSEECKRLDRWLQQLKDENAVVAYAPQSEVGFVYTERLPLDPADLPIRRNLVRRSA